MRGPENPPIKEPCWTATNLATTRLQQIIPRSMSDSTCHSYITEREARLVQSKRLLQNGWINSGSSKGQRQSGRCRPAVTVPWPCLLAADRFKLGGSGGPAIPSRAEHSGCWPLTLARPAAARLKGRMRPKARHAAKAAYEHSTTCNVAYLHIAGQIPPHLHLTCSLHNLYLQYR